jgi:hypothetical protein
MGYHKATIGETYLQASWEAEDDSHDRYIKYLNLATSNFDAALVESHRQFTVRLLLVELNMLK